MKRTKLSNYPEMLMITALHTSCRLEVGKMYQVDFVATDKNNENLTFFLKGQDKYLHSIRKELFEFVEVKIEAKIV
jgi:hypothetical protein